MMRFEVYRHISPSGKSYVGQTSLGARRWRDHVSDARRGSKLPFHAAIRKYGPESFTHEVLERLSTEAGAKRAEQLWIAELRTHGAGYNLTRGGEGVLGLKHSRESIERGAAKRRGRPPWNKGVPMSPEACAKNGAARRGKKQSAETIAKRFSPAARANMATAQRGHVQSELTIARKSAALKAAHAKRPDWRRTLVKYATGPRSPEHCARISVGHLKRSGLTPNERAEKKKAQHRARCKKYRAKASVKAARAERARAIRRAKKAA